MPIYEYQCESCGHRRDAIQKFSDPPLTDCAECGKASLRKLVSAPRFRLKGSGWYETDFKQDNRRNLAESGEGASGDGGSADGAKAGKDATPAAKTKEKSGDKTAGKGQRAAGSGGGTAAASGE